MHIYRIPNKPDYDLTRLIMQLGAVVLLGLISMLSVTYLFAILFGGY